MSYYAAVVVVEARGEEAVRETIGPRHYEVDVGDGLVRVEYSELNEYPDRVTANDLARRGFGWDSD
jgi:hypothetical protein